MSKSIITWHCLGCSYRSSGATNAQHQADAEKHWVGFGWPHVVRVARAEAVMRWVSCSQESDFTTSRHRHLLPESGDTTLCGATGLGDGVWRGSTAKPVCAVCADKVGPT